MEEQKYNILLRILHWLMAVVIIGLLVMGIIMEDMGKNEVISIFGTDYSKYYFYPIHKSFGMIALFLVAIRLMVRLFTKAPDYPKEISKLNVKLAKAGHHSLYLFMFLIPISGYTMSIAGGHGVKIFGLEVVALFEKNKPLGSLASDVHKILAYIIAVLVIHVAAAIKHRFVGKINILKRIL